MAVLLPLSVLGASISLGISAVWPVPVVFALLPKPVAVAISTRIDKVGLHPARLPHVFLLPNLVVRLVHGGAA